MARTIGKAFRIGPKAVRSYGYAKRGMRANPSGVTAIAAINGRGAGRGRRTLSSAERSAFASKLRAARARRMRGNSGTPARGRAASSEIARARQNIQRAIAARRSGRGSSSMRRNPWTGSPAQRAAALKNLARARAALRAKRGGGHTANRRHRSNRRRGHRKNRWSGNAAGHSAAAKKGWARRRARGGMTANRRRRHRSNKRRRAHSSNRRHRSNRKRRAHRSNRKRRAHRSNRKRRAHNSNRRRRYGANRRRHRRNRWSGNAAGHSAAAKKGWARRRARAGGHVANRRRRRTHRSNRRRHRSNRRRRYGANRRRRHRSNRRRRAHRSNRRRRLRANRRRYGANRRRRHRSNRRRSHRRNRRRYRSNRRRLFRRNQITTLLAVGGITAAGFIAHKALTKVLSTFVFDKLFGAPAAPMEQKPPTPPAASGMEALQPYKGIISGFAGALLGVMATNFVVRDVRTRMFLQAGIATSFMHNVIVTILDKVAPAAAGYLSGFGDFEDSTAARLSAMYGLGASIMPMYKPINGLGEYFESGVGPTAGVDGMLGQYGPNPDLYEAAAGFGATPSPAGTNHILPQSDLDRELTIAEAAAGVGQVAYEAAAGMGEKPFEAAAGIGEYYTDVLPKPMAGLGEYFTEGNIPGMSGFGAIETVPRADTWIPGMAHPELWAGVRGVSRPQASTAMVPAGVLQTGGGQGVFG